MDHPTTRWAHLYQMSDPGVPAQQVLGADASAMDRLSDRSASVAQAAEDDARLVAQALALLREAWSAQAAVTAVEAWAIQLRTVSAVCRGTAAAIGSYAAAIRSARSAVQDAYTAADRTIVDQGLIPDPPPLPPTHYVAVVGLRAHVVTELYGAASAAAAGLDRAAAELVSTIGPDPRDGLGTPVQPGPGPSRGPADLDADNRAALARDLSSPGRHAFAEAVDRALRHAATTGKVVQLLDYDPTRPPGQGGVAIAIGDVARAASVAVLVPGVGNSPSDASGSIDLAADLADATERAAPGGGAATVVYLAYDIPLSRSSDTVEPAGGIPSWLAEVGDAALAVNAWDAVAGGQHLAGFVHRLRRRMDPTAGLTLVGHSYGSTVVSQAAMALGPDAGVSDIVLLASPGAGFGVDRADDYRAVPADHVYTLEFPGDPIASNALDIAATAVSSAIAPTPGSAFGADPAHGFGAQVIDAPSSVPTVVHASGWNLLNPLDPGGFGLALAAPVVNVQHHAMSNYLSGTALAAVAAVTAGRYAKVPVKSQR